jgi:hypothetical protein
MAVNNIPNRSSINRSEIFKASTQQEEMWINSQNTSFTYWNFLVSRLFKGKLDITAFRDSLEMVIRRHSGLRTGFIQKESILYQLIENSFDIDEILEINICTCTTKKEFDLYIMQHTKEMLQYTFQIERGLLFRVKLFCFGEIIYVIILFNHLICDYISTQILWNDLVYCYNCRLNQMPVNFKSCLQYYEYSEHQKRFLETKVFDEKKAYWNKKLDRSILSLKLPFGSNETHASIVFKEIPIPQMLMSDLRSLALKKRVVFSAIFQLAYYIVLERYSGQKTISILNIFHSRGVGSQKNSNTIGLFADTLLNTIELEDDLSFHLLLQRVNSEIQSSIANSEVPYKEVFKSYHDKFRHNQTMFQADFNMLKMNSMSCTLSGLVQYGLEDKAIATKFDTQRNVCRTRIEDAKCSLDIQSDISLTIKDDATCSKVRMTILCDRNKQEICNNILKNYIAILKKIAYYPDLSLKDIILENNF